MSIWETLTGEEQETKRIYGVVGAVVTNNKDKKGMGRVKVNFPWLSKTHETDWIRIATLMSGNKTGTFFLPEVGDEVLVACENGNIDKPYVIGTLWNGKSKAPVTNSDGKNNVRQIKTRSGHLLVFDDTDRKESVEIKTKAGHRIQMKDESGKEQITIQSKGGLKVLLDDASGKITITSKKEIQLDAQKINLGKSAKKTLVTDNFIELFNKHTHTGNQGADTSPPPKNHQAEKNTHSTKTTKGA